MVNIIRENRLPNRGQQFGKAIGAGISSGAKSYAENLLRNEENEAIQRQTGLDLSGIRDPQTRATLIQDQLAFGRKMRQAEASRETNLNQVSPQRSFQERLNFQGIEDISREEEPIIKETRYQERPPKVPQSRQKERPF